jgi:hypothetical protein
MIARVVLGSLALIPFAFASPAHLSASSSGPISYCSKKTVTATVTVEAEYSTETLKTRPTFSQSSPG